MNIFKKAFSDPYNAGFVALSTLYLSLAVLTYFTGYDVAIQDNKLQYEKGYQAGLNYTPPAMQRIDSLTIPEFTAKERRIIAQFMLIIKKASEVKE